MESNIYESWSEIDNFKIWTEMDRFQDYSDYFRKLYQNSLMEVYACSSSGLFPGIGQISVFLANWVETDWFWENDEVERFRGKDENGHVSTGLEICTILENWIEPTFLGGKPNQIVFKNAMQCTVYHDWTESQSFPNSAKPVCFSMTLPTPAAY